MSDGSTISSYVPSEANSEHETTPSKNQSSVHKDTDLNFPGQGTSEDVYTDLEGERQPRASRRRGFTPAEDEIANLRTGHRSKIARCLGSGYLDLLNSAINNARDGCIGEYEPQLPSRVSFSPWSAQEKDRFFTALTSKGRGNSSAIAEYVGTKSESEVRRYLELLEDGAYPSTTDPVSSPIQQPAACEISADCDRILDVAAHLLAKRVDKQDISAERERSGPRWLLDEEVADEIERRYEDAEQQNMRNGDGPKDCSPPRSDSPDETMNSPDAGIKKLPTTGEIQTEAPSSERRQFSQGSGEILEPAEELLRPKAFLELSRNLFMNHGDDGQMNWHSMGTISDVSDTPALFRSTLADFYNLTISLTRRLVQTTLFQATSRLRAEDVRDRPPAPLVRELDVRTAIDVLGMTSDRNRYWATAPRRCHVAVYSRDPSYKDGRASTRTGFPLSHDEVEAALGLTRGRTASAPADPSDDPVHDIDVWEAMYDDTLDLLTDVSPSPSPPPQRPSSGFSATPSRYRNPRKRKPNDGHTLRAETRYLECLDHEASLAEEDKLWATLRLDPPKRARTEKAPLSEVVVAEDEEGEPRALRAWRDRVEYMAEWERVEPVVGQEEFLEMEEKGRKGRARRGRLFKKVEERLENQSDGGEDDSEGNDEDVSDGVEDDKNGESWVESEDGEEDGAAGDDESEAGEEGSGDQENLADSESFHDDTG